MPSLHVHNHGPLILETDYWSGPLNQRGLFFASVNAGAIRLLVPSAHTAAVADMRTAKHVVLSRGPWPQARKPGERYWPEGIELLFDDGSDSPFALHLTPESFDLLPAAPEPGREWVLSVWTTKDGRPHKALERICHWRQVEKLPCLKPWKYGNESE